MPNVVIDTERLHLREYKTSDLKDVHEYGVDPQVCKYLTWGPNGEKETRDFIRKSIEDSKDKPRFHYQFAIVLRETNKVIGGAGLILTPADHRQAEIGYVLNRAFWGNGYMTEAVRALITYGFEQLKLHRIIAKCDPQNKDSERIMQKCHMRREAHCMKDQCIKGIWRDTLIYAILSDE